MTPYLHPRMMGIDKLEIYIEGFKKFLTKFGVTNLIFEGWDGTKDLASTQEKIKSQIDDGWLIPCLTLKHKNPALQTYVWHWFLLTGYDDENFQVKITTYGKFNWVNFAEFWDTGFEQKGGLVLIRSE